jgi:hypothetical protein
LNKLKLTFIHSVEQFFTEQGYTKKSLDKKEFLTRLGLFGITVTPKDVELFFPLLDVDGSQTVTIDEFMGFFALRSSDKSKQQITDSLVHDMTVCFAPPPLFPLPPLPILSSPPPPLTF